MVVKIAEIENSSIISAQVVDATSTRLIIASQNTIFTIFAFLRSFDLLVKWSSLPILI